MRIIKSPLLKLSGRQQIWLPTIRNLFVYLRRIYIILRLKHIVFIVSCRLECAVRIRLGSRFWFFLASHNRTESFLGVKLIYRKWCAAGKQPYNYYNYKHVWDPTSLILQVYVSTINSSRIPSKYRNQHYKSRLTHTSDSSRSNNAS